ncbi:hypothetical protein FS837_009518 [Tulasnella sp. UAMH 9824]|nr:hypothetical protein FS837_009518 [Tulasnella sp. UAMH 9824]
MDSIEEQPSSPSKPYSMPSSSMATTLSRPAQDTARPAPRWAKSVTYGRKKDPVAEENDTEPESDAMDVTDTPLPSTSRATFTTPAPKPRVKTTAASPSRPSRSPSPKLGDDSDDEDNVDLGNSSSASKFGLTNWRNELNAIDKQFDEEEEEELMKRRSRPEHSRPSEDEDAEMDTQHDSTVDVNPPRAGNLHLTSSLSTLSEDTAQSPSSSANKPYRSRKAITTLESSSEPDEDEDPLGSTSAHNSRSHRPVKKRAVMDSDEEGEVAERPTKLSRRSLAADTSRSSISPQQAERMFDSPLAKIDGSPPSTPPEDPDSTAAAPDVSSSALSKSKKGKRVSSAGKPKKLSKKEQHNMWMETEILKAQAPVHVPEEEREQPRLSMTDLFQRIGKVVPSGHTVQFNRRRTEISSDPIVDSSQPMPNSTAVVSSGATFCPETPVFETQAPGTGGRIGRVLVPNSSHSSIEGSALANRVLSSGDEGDSDMLPDSAEQIRMEELRKRERAQKELKEKKMLWAAQQRKAADEKRMRAAASLDDDDEDELEIEVAMADSQSQSLEIVESQHGQFNTGEQLRKAVVKDRLHAAISPFKPSSASKAPKEFRHPRKSVPTTDSFIEYLGKTDLLGVKSKPAVPKSRASMPMIKKPSTFGPLDLKSKLLKDVRLEDAKTRRERDEEWEGRGGHAGRKQQIEQAAKLKQLGGEKALEEWAKKGIEVAEAGGMVRAEFEYEEEEEGEEEDEDYKPEEQGVDGDAEMDEDERQGENAPVKVERSRSSSVEPNTEDEDKENRVIEDKENVPPPRKARAALADKDDLFSPHHPSEAEDEPEDKENAPPSRAQDDAEDDDDDDDLFGLRPAKKHTARRIVADEDEEESSAAPSKDENIPPRRSPLKFNAFDDDDERPPRPEGLPFGGAGGKMLMFNSSAESLVDGGAEKEKTAGGIDDGFDMSDADAEIEGDGFTQLFALESKPAGFDALRQREPLDDMDLESQKLLPVMDLSTQEMQKDDAIFEQDQIVRAAIEREERQKTLKAQTKIYLNEDGFFTQTKPATQMPIDFPADSQGFFAAPTMIDDDVLASQEQDAPLRRLRRGHVRQESEDSPMPSTTLAPPQTEKRDAFSVLMTAKPKEPKKKDKEKEKQMKEFFQDQADESDEDKIIGFGDTREDENDDDEENDKHLEGLVDDKKMEDSEVNEQAVLEKHQEQLAQDDAALEKYHAAAAKGEYRGKKRDRGIGLSDDESDGDDDENRRRRLALRKKRVVIGGDQLEDLANNSRTRAFYNTYEQGIAVDEENDFGYVPSSEQPEPEEGVVEEDEDEEGADDEEEKGDEPTQSRIVNPTELLKELRAAVDRGETSIDPHDIDWVDRSLSNYDDDMDDGFSVKEIPGSRKPAFRTYGQVEVDEESRRENIRLARLGDPKARTQPRREDKGATYGVSKAGTAITSHASKSKASSSSSSSKAGPGNRPLTKGASLLQRVPTKQGGFDA